MPTSTLVLGTILLVVVGFLGGWLVGRHSARRVMPFAFLRRHEMIRPGYGQGGFMPGGGWSYGPGFGTMPGGTMPGVPVPGQPVPGQPVPTAVPGSTGSSGSTGSPGSGG